MSTQPTASNRDSEQPMTRRQLQPCGTPSAYKRHTRHGEQPCEDCKTAYRAYNAKLMRDAYLRRQRTTFIQPPLMAAVRTPVPPPVPRPQGLPVTPAFLNSEQAAQIAVALLAGIPTMVVSYTRREGLRLHVDPAVADAWITAAPMADDDLADVYHLPARRTG